MPRVQRWFRVYAYAITITALLAIAALAVRLALVQPHRFSGWAITAAIVTALVCAWAGVALLAQRRPSRRPPRA